METETPETPIDVTTPSVETTPDATPAPTGSEAVTNPGEPDEQMIPFSRFQEVNNNLKQEREAKAELEQRLARAESAKTPENEVEIDEDVQKILDAYAKKNGFVSRSELEAERKQQEFQLQVKQDIADLTKELNGFDYTTVSKYAKENGLSINGKADLKSAYLNMNYAQDIENAKKAAIAEFQAAGRTTGETAATATRTPSEEPVQGVKSRIAATRQKLGL